MRKRIHWTLLILCGTLLAAAPPAYADKIANIANHPIAAKMSEQDLRKNIVLAATKRGWMVEDAGPQQLKATISAGRGQYEAAVNITYSDSAYSITLMNSKGFGQTGDSVNGRVNRWMKNLEADIAKQLASPAV